MFILQVWAVSYNSDGSKVLSVSEDKQALVYSIPGNIASPKDLWFHERIFFTLQFVFSKVSKIQRTRSLHQTILASHKSPPKLHQNSNFFIAVRHRGNMSSRLGVILKNKGVRWVGLGWTAFLAENIVLSENRTWIISMTGDNGMLKIIFPQFSKFECIFNDHGFGQLDRI